MVLVPRHPRSVCSRLLVLSARPWLPSLPSCSFRRQVRRGQLPLDSPPSGCELPLWLQRRVRNLFSSALMQVGARIGEGRSTRGRNQERPAPHRGSPAPVPSLGSRRLSSVGLSPAPPSHGSSPKTEIVELEGTPSPLSSLGQLREEGAILV